MFSRLIGAYIGATAANAMSPPQLFFNDPDFICKGLKASGPNSWNIKYGRKGQSSTSTITISHGTSHTTAAGGIDIYWP